MRLLRAFPAIRLLAPLLAGVIGGAFALERVLPSEAALIVLFGLWSLLCIVLLIWSFTGRMGSFFGALTVLTALLGGVLLLFSVSGQLYRGHFTRMATKTPQTYLVTVDGEVYRKPNSIKMEGDAISSDGKYFGRVLLYLHPDSVAERLGHGDRLLVYVALSEVRSAGNPNEFNYARYLRFHHIHHQAYVPEGHWELVEVCTGSPIRFFIGLRRSMMDVFIRAGLEDDRLAVASALVLGYKADLDQSLLQSYSGAGATHVLAVSGLHVGIVYLIFQWVFIGLTRIPHGERIRSMVIVALLVGYAFLTGLSPSVSRAVTMFSFVALAKSFDRRGSIYNTLAGSAIGLVIYDPLILMQVGFQLSYAAVLGIVLLQPWLLRQMTFNNWMLDKVWEVTCVSVAAQLATFPLGLLYFHQFPNLFFISNLFVIPAATIALGLGIFAMPAQLWEPLLKLTGEVLSIIIGAMNGLVELIDKIPYAVTNGVDISVTETVLIYALIGCTAWMLMVREMRMVLPVSGLCLLLALTQTIEYGAHQSQRSLTVYNIRKETALAVMDGTRLQFLASPGLLDNEQSLLFHVQHHWWAQGVKEQHEMELTDSLFNRPFTWNGKHVVLVAKPEEGHTLEMPDTVDVAIIHSVNWKEIETLALQMPQQVVLSSALGERTRDKLAEAMPAGVKLWDVARDGAFTLH
jgi:competence protein ComEC